MHQPYLEAFSADSRAGDRGLWRLEQRERPRCLWGDDNTLWHIFTESPPENAAETETERAWCEPQRGWTNPIPFILIADCSADVTRPLLFNPRPVDSAGAHQSYELLR